MFSVSSSWAKYIKCLVLAHVELNIPVIQKQAKNTGFTSCGSGADSSSAWRLLERRDVVSSSTASEAVLDKVKREGNKVNR